MDEATFRSGGPGPIWVIEPGTPLPPGPPDWQRPDPVDPPATPQRLQWWSRLVLARTIYGEARGEPLKGRVAVAAVVRNRLHDPATPRRWPAKIAGVCLQPKQFSCWNETDPNRLMLAEIDDVDLAEEIEIVDDLFAGRLVDPTFGANHYLNTRLANPSWFTRNRDKVTAVIGRHTFLRLP